MVIFLQAPTLPPSAPWWAAAGLGLVAVLSPLLGAWLSRSAPAKLAKIAKDAAGIAKTQAEHGATLAELRARVDELEATPHTDPAARAQHDAKVHALAGEVAEIKRRLEESREKRAEADATLARSLGAIEAHLENLQRAEANNARRR